MVSNITGSSFSSMRVILNGGYYISNVSVILHFQHIPQATYSEHQYPLIRLRTPL
jgi:hypothetical protein